MTVAFEQVRALIPRLDPGERQKLKMLITRHPGSVAKTTAISVNPMTTDWLLQGILSELARRGHKHRIKSMEELRRIAPDYELSAGEVREALEEMLNVQMERILIRPSNSDFLTLGTVSARALIKYFEPRMTVALRPVLNVVGRTFEALENSFPDYLGSGMLPVLIQRKA